MDDSEAQRGALGSFADTGQITNIKKNTALSLALGFESQRICSVPNVGTGGVYSGPARLWLDSEAIV